MNNELSVQELTAQAKLGDLNAKNKLFKRNIDAIIKIATKAYNEIIKIYKVKPNSKIPDNLIAKDDVIQDFLIKGYQLLNSFLNSSNDMFFSVYLSIYLKPYTNTYIKTKRISLNETVQIEPYHNLDNSFYNYLNYLKEEQLKQYIFDKLKEDSVLSNYEEFIKLIFSGYSYDRLEEITKLDTRKINMKLNLFIKNFKKRQNLKKCQDKYLKLFDDVKAGCKDAKNQIYNYHLKDVNNYVLKAYNQINKNSTSENIVLYERIMEDFRIKFNKYLDNYIKKAYSMQFKTYLSKTFNSYVKSYVNTTLNSTRSCTNTKIKTKK